MNYCNDLNKYSRFKTREVYIGNIALGGNNPIRIQSMTNTDTLDTQASVEQCMRIFDAGADYVRLTTQAGKHAQNLENIKSELISKGYKQALIADVHFNPKAAEIAAKIIEKVRINPGNFAELNNSKNQYSYEQSLQAIEQKFTELINICKKHNTTLRIGSNHGSLSARIVDKYGDTVEGMVESVMEYLRIAQKNDFHNIVISLKSSNTRVMVFAYRLLTAKMLQENFNYPIHLGVTEAGDGEDGRIKSAIGIGALLADGIGDTIRVSLTEAPEKEIPVAQSIVEHFAQLKNHKAINGIDELTKNPIEYSKRPTFNNGMIGSDNKAVVIANLSAYSTINDADIEKMNFKFVNNKWRASDNSPDFIFIGKSELNLRNNTGLQFICDISNWKYEPNVFPYFKSIDEYKTSEKSSDDLNFIEVCNSKENIDKLSDFKSDKSIVLLLKSDNKNSVADKRAFIQHLQNRNLQHPIITCENYDIENLANFQIKSACNTGLLLIDGLIDGIMLSNYADKTPVNAIGTSFAILQASRTRMSKTEFISCPSCGRTLFEIEKVTAQIKQRTGHLKGLKIAVMGCIVNGPGEMADADYGYVGAGSGRVSLYKGKELVKGNIKSENALDLLVDLIKDNKDWKNKEH